MEVQPAPLSRGVASSARDYWMAWAATLIFFAGFYALLTPLPSYLERVGLADWQIGLVLGAFGVASLVGRPIAGRLADQYGPRPVMLGGAALLVIGAACVGLARDVALLFLLRLLQAAGYVAFTTAATGLVMALAPPDERGRRLAVFGAAANVAISLTPAVVSALIALTAVTAGFAASALLGLAAGVLAWLLPGTPPPAGQAGGWAIPRRLWPSMGAAALLGAGFVAFFQFVPILAARRGELDAAWLYAAYGAGIIATRFGAGGLVDRWGVPRVLVVTTLLMVAGLLVFAVARGPWLLVASLLVAASGLFHPALLAHHAALLPGAPGAASATFYIGFDLGIGLGSWLLGLALELAGLTGLYLAAALAALCAIGLVPAIAAHHTAAEEQQ